jgi:hypothetical protein
MKLTVACDVCGKVLNADEAKYDQGDERDLCQRHFIEAEIVRITEERRHVVKIIEVRQHQLTMLDAQVEKLRNTPTS